MKTEEMTSIRLDRGCGGSWPRVSGRAGVRRAECSALLVRLICCWLTRGGGAHHRVCRATQHRGLPSSKHASRRAIAAETLGLGVPSAPATSWSGAASQRTPPACSLSSHTRFGAVNISARAHWLSHSAVLSLSGPQPMPQDGTQSENRRPLRRAQPCPREQLRARK
jgi:hypothetical protein